MAVRAVQALLGRGQRGQICVRETWEGAPGSQALGGPLELCLVREARLLRPRAVSWNVSMTQS